MRFALPFLLLSLLLCGCARDTIEARKQQRFAAYTSLPGDQQRFVDEGKISVGMSMDAVYMAWGKPRQIVEGQSPDGRITTTWLYEGTYIEDHRYWAYRPSPGGNAIYYEAYLAHDHYPRAYVRAEVRFENGLLKDWQQLPRPTY